MKKNLLTLLLCSFAFGLGFGINNFALSDGAQMKVAYVNVPKLLNSSKILKSADETRVKQTQDMLKWYDTASADIQKQKTQQGRETLIKKYEAQLTTKKKAINDAYSKKVHEVDSQLEKAISDKAKAMGYELVFKSDSLIVGGDDITSSILPLVK